MRTPDRRPQIKIFGVHSQQRVDGRRHLKVNAPHNTVVTGRLQRDDEGLPKLASYRRDQLGEEARPVPQVAALLISSPVRPERLELMEQVPMPR